MGRPDITDLGLSMGKKGRLRRILHQSGLRNGTVLLLPSELLPLITQLKHILATYCN